MDNITYVTGLWDIGRDSLDNTDSNHDWKRSFKTYTDRLEELLSTGLQIIVYGENVIKDIVSKYPNCVFVEYSKDIFYQSPYFTQIDNIRTSKEWYDQPTAQWLKSSPQAMLPLYISIQLNKMLCIKKSTELNPFHSNSFFWIDAGITKTHEPLLLQKMNPSLLKYHKFIFLSHRYVDNTEVHGFLREGLHRHCNKPFVDRIMKGFFFGGRVDKLDEILELYNKVITETLNDRLLGCDETYFTILVNQRPDLFDQIIIPHCFNTMLSF